MANAGKDAPEAKTGSNQDGILQIGDWSAWHDEYENDDSELNARKRAVQAQVAAIVAECPPGPVTVISICGGQGREVIGALENHPRRADVGGRIVELDEHNAAFARAWAKKANLNVDVLTGDASISDSYAGLPPADVVVISGVCGHINAADRARLVGFTRQILRTGGSVVWTFLRWNEDQFTQLRGFFREQMFEEKSLETTTGKFTFTITRNQLAGAPTPFAPNAKIFTFGSSREGREQANS